MRKSRAIATLLTLGILMDFGPGGGSGCANDTGRAESGQAGQGGVIVQTTPPLPSEEEPGAKPRPMAPDAVSKKWSDWTIPSNGEKPEPVPTIDAAPLPGDHLKDSERHVLFMAARAPSHALMRVMYGVGTRSFGPYNVRPTQLWTANELAAPGETVWLTVRMPNDEGNLTCAIRVTMGSGDGYVVGTGGFREKDPGPPEDKACYVEGVVR